MPKPLLLVVSGPPGAGKTTLGRRLAGDLGLPFMNKDGIKEGLFATMGWKDRPWSRELGRASADLLLYFAEVELSAGRSLVIESAFWREHSTAALNELERRCPHHPIQVHFRAQIDELVRRFSDRDSSGHRHPGHVDPASYGELQDALLAGRYDALEIGGELIVVDTTDFNRVDYNGLLAMIRRADLGD